MELKDVQRKPRKTSSRLNLQITDEDSQWMKSHNVSPQMTFDLAVAELRLKEELESAKKELNKPRK